MGSLTDPSKRGGDVPNGTGSCRSGHHAEGMKWVGTTIPRWRTVSVIIRFGRCWARTRGIRWDRTLGSGPAGS